MHRPNLVAAAFMALVAVLNAALLAVDGAHGLTLAAHVAVLVCAAVAAALYLRQARGV